MVNWGLPSRRVKRCQVPRHKQVIFKSDSVRFGLCRLKAMDVPETSGWSKLHPLQSWPLESNCETGLPGKDPFCPVPQLRAFFCQVLFWWSQGARVGCRLKGQAGPPTFRGRKPSGAFKDNLRPELMAPGKKVLQTCTSDGYTRALLEPVPRGFVLGGMRVAWFGAVF